MLFFFLENIVGNFAANLLWVCIHSAQNHLFCDMFQMRPLHFDCKIAFHSAAVPFEHLDLALLPIGFRVYKRSVQIPKHGLGESRVFCLHVRLSFSRVFQTIL